MTSITQLEQQFEVFTADQRDLGKSISTSISMLQLDQVQEAIASAVVEIEKVTNKSEKASIFQKIPLLGKFISAAKESSAEEQLREGNMVEVVDRLFNSLSAKKDNIVSVANTLFDLKEKLQTQVIGLTSQEEEVKQIAYVEKESRDTFQAKNLLVQISPTIQKAVDRIDVIDVTIKSAQVSASKISALLPSLHGDLITELAIQAGLQELKDFKQIFDATVDVVEELSATNNTTMNEVLLDVADLAVNKPTTKALARIESTNAARIKLSGEIRAKMKEAVIQRDVALETISEARQAQTHNLLGEAK